MNDVIAEPDHIASAETVCLEPAAKKARTDVEPVEASGRGVQTDLEFRLRFTQPGPAKHFVEIATNILRECHFRVSRGSGGFEGLVVESMDPTRVSMLQAKVACRVQMPADVEEATFCVRLEPLNTILRQVQPHYFLEIDKQTKSTDIQISAYEPQTCNYQTKYSIKTLAMNQEVPRLDDQEFDFTVEIDLVLFRSIIRGIRDHKIENVRFRVYEPPVNRSAGGRNGHTADRINQRDTYFVISAASDEVQAEHLFYHTSEWREERIVDESGYRTQVVIKTTENQQIDASRAPRLDQMESLYHEEFSSNNLAMFLKSMERATLTMRLSPGKPLMLHYPLGSAGQIGSESYIMFVLAPKIQE